MNDVGTSGSAGTLAHATASMLALGVWFAGAGAALTLVAFAALIIGQRWPSGWLASLVLGAVGMYYALRVRFDQHLFANLARRVDAGIGETAALEQLDTALRQLSLRRADLAGLPLAGRARGALLLMYVQAAVTAMQFVLSTGLLWAASR